MPLNRTVGGDGRALFWIFWLVRWRRGRLGHDGHQQRAEALEHVLTDARELIRSGTMLARRRQPPVPATWRYYYGSIAV